MGRKGARRGLIAATEASAGESRRAATLFPEHCERVSAGGTLA